MYKSYTQARDMSWRVLLNSGSQTLPIDLNHILDCLKLEIRLYSDTPIESLYGFDVAQGDGFTVLVRGKPTIYLNDQIANFGRRRFTVAHEIGHHIMGHPLGTIRYRNSELDNPGDPLEIQANVFARDLLAPACVLHAMGVKTPEEIMRVCGISHTSAEIRSLRLEELHRRGRFGQHPLERMVQAQFHPFITDFRKKTSPTGL